MKSTVLALIFALASCKSGTSGESGKSGDPGPPAKNEKPTAPAGAPAAAKPAGPVLDGTKLTAVRCEIAGLGSDFKRSLQVDTHGTLYVFDDANRPHKIAAGAGPCGLAAAGDVSPSPFVFAADGSVAPTNEETGGECKSRSFVAFAWRGTTFGGQAYVVDGNVRVEDLRANPCTSRVFTKDLPTGRVADVAANQNHVLLVDFHASGNDENAVWRYRPDGTLVDKIGLKPGGGSQIGWIDEVATCADGVCALESGSLVVFDAAGRLVAKHNLHDAAPDLKGLETVDLVEVGGRALYALVTFKNAKGEKTADLLRLDGVYR